MLVTRLWEIRTRKHKLYYLCILIFVSHILNTTYIDGLKCERGVINQPYCDQVKQILDRIPADLAERLFGKESDYASTSGKGSETKLFRELKNAILGKNVLDKNSASLNEISNQLLAYLWQHIVSELDVLGHHYEIDDISSIKVDDSSIVTGQTFKGHLSFDTAVTIYIDSEDETGIMMSFPTEATVECNKNELGKWKLDENGLVLHFDTSKYGVG